MADERIVERTVERGGPVIVERRGGGAAGWVVALIALVALGLLGWYLLGESRNDTIRTEAVTDAAGTVAGAAEKTADKVGDAINGK